MDSWSTESSTITSGRVCPNENETYRVQSGSLQIEQVNSFRGELISRTKIFRFVQLSQRTST